MEGSDSTNALDPNEAALAFLAVLHQYGPVTWTKPILAKLAEQAGEALHVDEEDLWRILRDSPGAETDSSG